MGENYEILPRGVGKDHGNAVPRLARVDRLILVAIEISAKRVTPWWHVLDDERAGCVSERDIGVNAVWHHKRLDERTIRRRSGDPIKHVARDSGARNRSYGGKKSPRARVANISANVGQTFKHDHGVRGIRAPATRRLHADRVAMPRGARDTVAGRDQKKVAEGCYRRRSLSYDLIELEEHFLRLDANAARVGNDRDDLGRRNVRRTAGRHTGRSAAKSEERDGDQPPQSAFTFSTSCSRLFVHSSSLFRSFVTTLAGALLVKPSFCRRFDSAVS